LQLSICNGKNLLLCAARQQNWKATELDVFLQSVNLILTIVIFATCEQARDVVFACPIVTQMMAHHFVITAGRPKRKLLCLQLAVSHMC